MKRFVLEAVAVVATFGLAFWLGMGVRPAAPPPNPVYEQVVLVPYASKPWIVEKIYPRPYPRLIPAQVAPKRVVPAS